MKEIDQSGETPLATAAGAVLPMRFRFIVGAVALIPVLLSTIYIARYTYEPERFVRPTDLGLTQFILGGALLLFVVITPWNMLGVTIRKVGFVEFDRIISAQTQEHIQAITELRSRIEELETRVRGLDSVAPIGEHFAEIELQPLLTKFLRQFAPTAYSPLRIQQWGAQQPGFEKLGSFRQSDIRIVLQKLVASGDASTTVSQLGNTLYRAKFG